MKTTTSEGDKVTLEGRFGKPVPSGESDVDQAALSGCPPPAADGRAVIVRLDLTTTLESGMAGEVSLATGAVLGGPAGVDFVLGLTQGPECKFGEPHEIKVDFGTLQPHQSHTFTMWLVLPEAVTPNDPHPSEATLGKKDWFIETPMPSVNGHGAPVTSINGRAVPPDPYVPAENGSSRGISSSRVVECERQEQETHPGPYLAVIASTPKRLTQQSTEDYRELC